MLSLLLSKYNIILIIISPLLATTIDGQTCPEHWWPLSNSSSNNITYLTEIIKGVDISSVNQISTGSDRVSSTNNDAIYIKGGNLAATTDAAYNSYLVLPSDKYFCGYYSFPQISLNAIYNFTITFWINVKKPLATNKTTRVIEFSDTAAKKYGIGIYLKQGDNSANTAVTLEVIYTFESSGRTDVQTVSDIGAGFATGWNHVAITLGLYPPVSEFVTVIYYNGATSGIKQTGRISYIPVECLNFTSNFIGKSAKPDLNDVNLDAYLNDVKLYNITLSSDQVLAKYDAEKSSRTYTC